MILHFSRRLSKPRIDASYQNNSYFASASIKFSKTSQNIMPMLLIWINFCYAKINNKNFIKVGIPPILKSSQSS